MRALRITFASCLFTVLLTAAPAAAAPKEHWAWKPPVRPAVPTVKDTKWIRNPIDAFLLARLEKAGLTPAAPASREQLIRRVTLDLIGLPPTPAEIDAFLKDTRADAYEKVVDRLLASPQYGERWARHWLDLARYADSNGYEHDEPRPDAWRYRDYVIKAFNADKRYDRFLKEQLAGDELFPDDPNALVATGFNLLGPDMTDTADQAQRRQNTLDDMTDTAGLVFLGLTVGCARCHDHKFEPIPQTDYYRLQAFFAPSAFRHDLVLGTPKQREEYAAQMAKYQALIKPIQEEIASLEGPYRKRLTDAKLARLSEVAQAAHRTPAEKRTLAQKEQVETTTRLIQVRPQEVLRALKEADRAQHKELENKLKQFADRKPAPLPTAMGLHDGAGTPPKTFLLEGGNRGNPVDEVKPGFLTVLTPGNKEVPAEVKPTKLGTGRRSALANWLARPDHPLTARVMANRVWQYHFGRGIVATASDFGVRGERPTHPELLDWLATEFVAKGWSVKHLHRLMVTSSAYRQSCQPSAATKAKDPENQLFSRMNRQRLEGEVLRDSLLAVSGRLNPKMGGPGVFPPLPPEALRGVKGWTASPDPKDHVRRSVYVCARRNLRFPILEVFDLPDSNLSCPRRERSTTAPQALALLNAAVATEAATALAGRLEKEAPTEDERVTLAYRLTLARTPTASERKLCHEFLTESPLSELCRALFNLNEFVYRE
jgi:hypothetical protein